MAGLDGILQIGRDHGILGPLKQCHVTGSANVAMNGYLVSVVVVVVLLSSLASSSWCPDSLSHKGSDQNRPVRSSGLADKIRFLSS